MELTGTPYQLCIIMLGLQNNVFKISTTAAPRNQYGDCNKPVIIPSMAKRGVKFTSGPIFSLPFLNCSELTGMLWRHFLNMMGLQNATSCQNAKPSPTQRFQMAAAIQRQSQFINYMQQGCYGLWHQERNSNGYPHISGVQKLKGSIVDTVQGKRQ